MLDIGGDDRGAFALGRYRDMMLSEDNYDMFLVINCFRPLTKTPELCVEIKEEIEEAAGIKFTGIVNNSNLGAETTVADVESSFDYANAVSSLTGLPIVMTTVMDGLEVSGDNIFHIKLQKKIFEEDS